MLITLTTSKINAFGCFGNLGQKWSSKIKEEEDYQRGCATIYRNRIILLLSDSVRTGTPRYVGQHTDQRNRVWGLVQAKEDPRIKRASIHNLHVTDIGE